ncbi:MerR family transcriptional regulator [Noviherbaspirillum galbum]|uniref:MerR family transcriptional regulator n=1 Tax=Noviherbaspirillum galbum TaxID=2709383 RepID=A0A6B3SXP2_9BURK|nr:MerR family transcriptional regulator [Noviherbaspirillum galbum]NEX63936.1 MerR family transcriptional regulator [Noviherbaspirillum galbum]
MTDMLLKVGELARRTGLTVRTLHHYDEIGLLRPSARSGAGYRLYDLDDIERLHRIQALRQLDIPLAEIAALLQSDSADLGTVIDRQIAALEQQAERALLLRDRLASLRRLVHLKDEANVGDWLDTLAMMAVYDRYFTPEELQRLRARENTHTAILERLVGQVRDLMQRGVSPASPEALALAGPWLVHSLEHMAGDSRLIHKLDALHREQSEIQRLTGVDRAMLDYMTEATAEYRLGLYAKHLDPATIAEIRPRYFAHYRAWPSLIARAHDLQEQGVSPASPEAQMLAASWVKVFQDTWGADPVMREKVRAIHVREPDIMAGSGFAAQTMEFVTLAISHWQGKEKK